MAHVSFCQSQKVKSDWLFSYYMPYDNNLSHYGIEIINQIQDNITATNVVALVQADFDDTLGMARYIITKDSIQRMRIESEYSAFTITYENYLTWINNNFEYKKIAVIFLDHGGKLDELCLDEQPAQAYLKVDSLKSSFSKINESKIDLLFLQVCSKGSIEPIFEFKDVAKYTLFSQTVVGAPNSYYPKLFSNISNLSIYETLDIIDCIINNEGSDMYYSYSCVDNSKLDKFYTQFEKFITLLGKSEYLILSSKPKQVIYYGEEYWDILSFLECIVLDVDSLSIIREELIAFLTEELIIINKINPAYSNMKGFCGLSMYALTNDKKYSNLKFYNLLIEMPEVIFQDE